MTSRELPGDLQSLAEIGSNGLYANNTRRDLLRKLEPRTPLPKPLLARCPYTDRKLNADLVQYTDVPIMMPNELFEYLYWHSRDFFNRCVAGDVSSFWAGVNNADPKLWHHPMREVAGWRRMFVPCAISGDTVTYNQRGHNLHVLDWKPLTGNRSTKETVQG